MNENTDIGDAAILTLPVVALRDIIVFPHMTVNLDIGRKESIEAVRAAGRSDRYLAMIMQRDGKVEVPQEEDLYSFGTVVKVKQMLQLPGGLIRIQAEGISRIRVHSVLRKENCLVSQVEDVPEIEPSDALRGEAYRRALLKSFFEWIHNAQQNLSDEQMEQLKASDTPGYTADFISTQMPISPARRQAVLEENDVMERLVLIRRFLDEEIQIGRLEAEINGEVRSRMEKEQRDYYLRQKIKSIHDRLGDEISQDAEAEEYRQKLEKSGIPDEYKKKLEKEISRLFQSFDTTVTTIPGVGPIIGAVILSEVGDISRFSSADKLAAYIGVDPSVNQSGEFQAAHAHMSKRGSPYLRRCIWMASQVAVQRDPMFRAYYEKKTAEGLKYMTIIGHVTRKMTAVIFAILRDHKVYEPVLPTAA